MEFILLWASFLIIMATDLQRGILIGIVLAVLYFAWSYAQVTPSTLPACLWSVLMPSMRCSSPSGSLLPPLMPDSMANYTGAHQIHSQLAYPCTASLSAGCCYQRQSMQNGRSESANTMQVTVKAFTVVPSRSGVLRPPAEREVLNLFGARTAAVSLSGFIFFGSSLSISDQVTLAGPQVPPVLHLIIRVHRANPLQSDLQ